MGPHPFVVLYRLSAFFGYGSRNEARYTPISNASQPQREDGVMLRAASKSRIELGNKPNRKISIRQSASTTTGVLFVYPVHVSRPVIERSGPWTFPSSIFRPGRARCGSGPRSRPVLPKSAPPPEADRRPQPPSNGRPPPARIQAAAPRARKHASDRPTKGSTDEQHF